MPWKAPTIIQPVAPLKQFLLSAAVLAILLASHTCAPMVIPRPITLGDLVQAHDRDMRAFHDELLRDGARPLNLVESKMNRWIAGQGRRS